MGVVPPAAGQCDGDTGAAARHGRLWRAAVLLGGGAAGVIVVLGLSAAFAAAADAAPLPTPAVHPAAALGVVAHSATGAAAPLTRPVADAVRAATDGAARSLTTVHRTVAHVVRTIAASLPTTAATPTPVTGGSPVTAPPGVASGPLSTVASVATLGNSGPSPRTAVPGPGRPSPPPPHHSPFPPLTTNAAAEYAPTGQGGSPWGALSPTDLVLPALALGALLLAREKTPLLIFHPRYSPPG